MPSFDSKSLESPLRSSHNDSGYNAGPESAEKVCDIEKAFLKEKPLIHDDSHVPLPNTTFYRWSSIVVDYLPMVVMLASLCYMVLMRDHADMMEEEDGWAKAKLGGKRAAIQFYYDSQVGA